MNNKLFLLSFLVIGQAIFGMNFVLNSHSSNSIEETTNNKNVKKANYSEEANQYLGYGYDITSGPIYDTAKVLKLNTPILDLSKNDLDKKIKQFTPSKAENISKTYYSKSELSNEVGKLVSGDLSIGGRISIANVDISGSFDMSKTKQWSSVQEEQFGFYYIRARNKTIQLQIDIDDENFDDYLTDKFKSDAKKIVNLDGATNFIKRYGTHLLTGYNLGGIFEMTNYVATSVSNSLDESTTSFGAQVEAALSSYANGQVDFSFTNKYGNINNTATSTNKYRLLTYGGDTFPGLTIDHAFSKNLITGVPVYSKWTNSINDGRNLVIVDVPNSSSMIPIYRVLPSTEEFNDARQYILESYLNICNSRLKEYNRKNRDACMTDAIDDQNETTPSANINGYEQYTPIKDKKTQYVYSYTEYDPTKEIVVKNGTKIALDYVTTNCERSSFCWKVDSSTDFDYTLDEKSGMLELGNNVNNTTKFKLNFVANDVVTNSISFRVADNAFDGGDGSQESPYLISNPEQFEKFANPINATTYMDKHFKLIQDISLKNKTFEPIGTPSNPFSGEFDGNYYSILNYSLEKEKEGNFNLGSEFKDDKSCKSYFIGLFGRVTGKIKNLNLKDATIKINNTNIDNSKTDYTLFRCNGILVGRLDGTGSIDNCHIYDSTIDIKLEFKKLLKNALVSVGGVVGGIYDSGSITSSSIEISKNNKKSLIVNTKNAAYNYLGGVAGIIAAEKSEISKCSILGYDLVMNSNNALGLSTGGLIGRMRVGKGIVDCMVKNTTITSSNEKEKSKIVTDYYNGGLCGNFEVLNDDKPYVRNIVLDFKFGENNSVTVIATNDKGKLNIKNGYIFGALTQTNTDTNSSNIINTNYGSYFNSDHIVLVTPSSNSIDIIGSNKDVAIYDDSDNNFVSDLITNNDSSNQSWIKEGDNVFINYQTVKDFNLNTDNAKKNFYEGEKFSVGNISISPIMSDGSNYYGNINSYIVNCSGFDSNVIGVQTIKISVFNISKTYTVSVHKLKATGILVENNITKSFYQGDKLSINDIPEDQLKVKVFYENGSSEYLNLNDLTMKLENSKTNLVLGQNKVYLEYNGLQTYFIINAQEKNIRNVSIKNLPSKKTYSNEIADIDLSDLVLNVEYSNGQSEIIKYEDDKTMFEIYYAGSSNSTFKIMVSYGDYNIVTYDVDIIFSFDEFKTLVDSISSIDDLKNRYDAIRKALKVRKILSKNVDEYQNAEYETINNKLTQEIYEYNKTIESINNSFDDVIEFGNSLSYGNFTCLRLSSVGNLFAIALSILRKRGA